LAEKNAEHAIADILTKKKAVTCLSVASGTAGIIDAPQDSKQLSIIVREERISINTHRNGLYHFFAIREDGEPTNPIINGLITGLRACVVFDRAELRSARIPGMNSYSGAKPDINGWGASKISQREREIQPDAFDAFAASPLSDDDRIGQRYCGAYPRALVGLHNVQLTLHDAELPPKNNPGDDPHRYESGSKNPNAARPSRHYQIAIGFPAPDLAANIRRNRHWRAISMAAAPVASRIIPDLESRR